MLIFQPFKVVTYSFVQLVKSNTKGVTLEVNIVVVKYQAAQHSRVGLAEPLFRNISLLIEVCKDSQFEVKIVIFTAVLKFIAVELSQVSQLLAISPCLGGLRIYNLRIYGLQIYSLWIYNLQIYNLSNRGGLVRILIYRGITVRNLGHGGIAVHNLSIRYALARKINSETT